MTGNDIANITENMFTKQMNKKGKIIADAISHALGHKDWDIEGVKERCRLDINTATNGIFYFDDTPLIQFLDSSVEVSNDGNEVILKSQYMLLYKSDEVIKDKVTIDIE